jgi:hypothetical protein
VGSIDEPLTYVQWRKLCQLEFISSGVSWTVAMQFRHFNVDEAMSAHSRGIKPREFVSTVVARRNEALRKKVAR